ncbi:hypothetical protein, variant [Verruconis gallopava]|uniref:Arsenite methyltransferase n=1 Tax=Verruconis gallopava TaxID=253628 RepID=A0A0D2A365_9PEZI|nr:hypothetical protein, variant [Verruconis gallopava]KIW01243.1 hypothetical protein, variant [Verruconis gallopava]
MTDSNTIYKQVHEHYGSVARSARSEYSNVIAKAFGYSEEELSSIPADANLGLSCGNPIGIAGLREGETVIDLGSGAGFDVFLASKKSAKYRTRIDRATFEDMLERARQNQSKLPDAGNVLFIEAKITSIPLDDNIADCITSNCVINLVPENEKPLVFAEIARLLKPGGRVAISDILARKPLPPGLRENVALYVGCVAGASTKDDYTGWLNDVGFKDITIVDAGSDLNVYIDAARTGQAKKHAVAGASGCCDNSCCDNGTAAETIASEYDLSGININEWAGSFKIFAVKC